MPSAAFTLHFKVAGTDAVALSDTRTFLSKQASTVIRDALNRAAVVATVAAWQAYIEELLREAVDALRGTGSNLWPIVETIADRKLEQFSTPSADKIRELFAECLAQPDLPAEWVWPGMTAPIARMTLGDILKQRHLIAHGSRPAAKIPSHVVSQNLAFVESLARRTDDAVRTHLAAVFALPNPWPP